MSARALASLDLLDTRSSSGPPPSARRLIELLPKTLCSSGSGDIGGTEGDSEDDLFQRAFSKWLSDPDISCKTHCCTVRRREQRGTAELQPTACLSYKNQRSNWWDVWLLEVHSPPPSRSGLLDSRAYSPGLSLGQQEGYKST